LIFEEDAALWSRYTCINIYTHSQMGAPWNREEDAVLWSKY